MYDNLYVCIFLSKNWCWFFECHSKNICHVKQLSEFKSFIVEDFSLFKRTSKLMFSKFCLLGLLTFSWLFAVYQVTSFIDFQFGCFCSYNITLFLFWDLLQFRSRLLSKAVMLWVESYLVSTHFSHCNQAQFKSHLQLPSHFKIPLHLQQLQTPYPQMK